MLDKNIFFPIIRIMKILIYFSYIFISNIIKIQKFITNRDQSLPEKMYLPYKH